MPSELDPLLPFNPPAPEIRGYGYSMGKEIVTDANSSEPWGFVRHEHEINQEEAQEEEEDNSESLSTTKSALSTLGSIFTIVVLFAFIVLVLSPKAEDDKPIPSPREPSTIDERV